MDDLQYRLKNLQAIGFDLDKTLYKGSPEIDRMVIDYIIMRASEELGISKEDAKEKFDKEYSKLSSSHRSLMAIGITPKPLAQKIVQEALENADIPSVLQEDKELQQLLLQLSVKYKLFLITGSSRSMADDKLKALGINSNVFSINVYTLEGLSRKDGSAFQYVSELLGISLENMMFVGDREKVDIIPAKDNGLITAIVNNRSSFADFNLNNIYFLGDILI